MIEILISSTLTSVNVQFGNAFVHVAHTCTGIYAQKKTIKTKASSTWSTYIGFVFNWGHCFFAEAMILTSKIDHHLVVDVNQQRPLLDLARSQLVASQELVAKLDVCILLVKSAASRFRICLLSSEQVSATSDVKLLLYFYFPKKQIDSFWERLNFLCAIPDALSQTHHLLQYWTIFFLLLV